MCNLEDLSKSELINMVTDLQWKLMQSNPKPEEAEASQIHNYHFAGAKLLNLSLNDLMGSGCILSVHSTKGKELIKPIMMKDGFSAAAVNALMDDFQYSYYTLIQFIPIAKRLPLPLTK